VYTSDCRRTVKDKQTGQNVVLSDKDFELIQRLQSGKIPDADYDAFAVSLIRDLESKMFKVSF
jgi:hypothetical protein